MTQVLPLHPNLASLKKQAKQLLKKYRDGNEKALEQVRLFFPSPDQFNSLRDAQFVIARSYGYPGWMDLVRSVDKILLNASSTDERADQLVDLACLQYTGQDTDLRFDRAEKLLRVHPELAEHNFITAIVSHNLDKVNSMLVTDPTLATTVTGPRHWQPLMYLAYNRIHEKGDQQNALKIARLLLDTGADPNAYVMIQERYRFTVLTGAMGEGEGGIVNQPPHQYSIELAKLLLDAGADPNEGQGLYNTAFTQSGEFWLKLLVEYGLNKDSRLNWDESEDPCSTFDFLLAMAASRNFPFRVEYLLKQGADPNARSNYTGKKVHTIALTSGNDEIARRLLDAGATPEELSLEDQFTIAVTNNEEKKIKTLISQKPNLLNNLELLQNANEPVLSLLISQGLDIDQQDKDGKSLLHYMAANGNLEGVRFLLNIGARDDLRDSRYGGTALAWAHFSQKVEVRNYMLEQSANPNELAACGDLGRLKRVLHENPALVRQTSSTGNTPLHLVCNWLGAGVSTALRAELMDLLLHYGADINAVNQDGLTPLGLNRQENIEDNVSLLLERGAR